MTINTNPFLTATINRVSISTENKRARKEVSSSQPIQSTKQVWRPRSIVVKENTRAQSHEESRKNERKEWRPRPERKIEHSSRHVPYWQSVFQRLQFPRQRDQPKRERYEQQIPQISNHPAPRDSKQAMEVNYSQGRFTIRITMRNEESIRRTRMIKPKVESNKGEWFLNKYGKGKHPIPQPIHLTWTHKRRRVRKRSIQKMRNMVAISDQAKHVERKEVASPKAEIIQDIQGQI